ATDSYLVVMTPTSGAGMPPPGPPAAGAASFLPQPDSRAMATSVPAAMRLKVSVGEWEDWSERITYASFSLLFRHPARTFRSRANCHWLLRTVLYTITAVCLLLELPLKWRGEKKWREKRKRKLRRP